MTILLPFLLPISLLLALAIVVIITRMIDNYHDAELYLRLTGEEMPRWTHAITR